MHPSLTVYRKEVLEYIHGDFEVETLADDCLFTEGPVWSPQGYYLFSDITGNCIYKITPDGKKEVFLANSGTPDVDNPDIKKDQAGSNGLAFDRHGDLLVCRHGSHGIAKYRNDGLQEFIHSYKGMPFNSPNDLIVHDDSRVYFSDPPYGLKDGQLNPSKFQPLAGVYCWKDGEIELVCDKYAYPNGVCLSPDQKRLYICSNKPFERFISVYDTGSGRFLHVFAEENSDGIEVDQRGNIYLCNKDGIIILDPNGERLALLQLPSIPANACWSPGGDLLITARQNIFLIRSLQKGV